MTIRLLALKVHLRSDEGVADVSETNIIKPSMKEKALSATQHTEHSASSEK